MVLLADFQAAINARRIAAFRDVVMPNDQNSDKALYQMVHDLLAVQGLPVAGFDASNLQNAINGRRTTALKQPVLPSDQDYDTAIFQIIHDLLVRLGVPDASALQGAINLRDSVTSRSVIAVNDQNGDTAIFQHVCNLLAVSAGASNPTILLNVVEPGPIAGAAGESVVYSKYEGAYSGDVYSTINADVEVHISASMLPTGTVEGATHYSCQLEAYLQMGSGPTVAYYNMISPNADTTPGVFAEIEGNSYIVNDDFLGYTGELFLVVWGSCHARDAEGNELGLVSFEVINLLVTGRLTLKRCTLL